MCTIYFISSSKQQSRQTTVEYFKLEIVFCDGFRSAIARDGGWQRRAIAPAQVEQYLP